MYKESLRVVKDFPKSGINFFDITSILINSNIRHDIITDMIKLVRINSSSNTAVIGIESRGFVFATELADKLELPLILARKSGKLPDRSNIISYSYDLEYSSASLEMNKSDAISYNNYIVVDDIIATGGTMKAIDNIIKSVNPIANIQYIAPFAIKGLMKEDLNYSFIEELVE